MAPRKDAKLLHQPEKLEILATSEIIDWIISQATTDVLDLMHPILDLSQKLAAVRDYFKNTPGMIINNLLAEARSSQRIMLHHETDAPKIICGKISRWIEVFFTRNVTCLSIKFREIYEYKESFVKNSHLLEGVVKLVLYSNKMCELHESQECIEFAEFIKNLRSLKYLELFYCSDKISRCILDNCKSLVSIVLHSYYYISTETFDVITQLPNLETVSLYGSLRDRLHLYLKLVDLNNQVLIDLSLRKQFVIKSFVITDQTKEEDLEVIRKYPMIEQLDYVALPSKVRVPMVKESLQYLQSLENLQVLKIYGFNFYDDHIKYMIGLLGNKIVDLRLLKIKGIDLQALKFINQMCPRLQSLGIIIDRPVSCKGNDSCISGTEENSAFKNLQNLYLKVGHNTSSLPVKPSLEESFVRFLLENSPNIETVHLDRIILTNDFLVKVLDKNPLRCLKEFYIPRELGRLQVVINHVIENGLSPKILICDRGICPINRALAYS